MMSVTSLIDRPAPNGIISGNSIVEEHGNGTGRIINIFTVGSLIRVIKQLESRFENYYAAARDNSCDNGSKLLSYYLGRHNRHFRSVLNEFGPLKLRKIQQDRIRKKLEIFPEKWLDFKNMPARQITGKDLLEAAILYNRKLIALYKNILSQPLTKDTRILITTLQNLEKNESTRFKKMLAINYF